MIAGFHALLLQLTAALAAQTEDVPGWQWEPDSALCTLTQKDSDHGGEIIIRRTPGDDQTTVRVRDRGARGDYWRSITGMTVTLEPGGSVLADGYFGPGEQAGSREILVRIPDQTFLSRFPQAQALAISHARFGLSRTYVRSAAAVPAALRACEDRRMREWGIDPAAWWALRSRPIPITPLNELLQARGYPRNGVIFRVQGDVVLRLAVGLDGRVSECEGLNRRVDPAFNVLGCDALKRKARFQPATDQQGRPVAAPFIVIARYRVEG